MAQQVITIDMDGRISGLQHKKGKGLDLRQFGACEIRRASEIVPTADGQGWLVHLLTGPLAGKLVTRRTMVRARCDSLLWLDGAPEWDYAKMEDYRPGEQDGIPLVFSDYDDAVKAEIAVLDGLRLQGEF